jgi:hypothetical protein
MFDRLPRPELTKRYGQNVYLACWPGSDRLSADQPALCSNASSLPEVAGDAALLFDPRDETAIAQALSRLLDDSELRDRLRARGLARAGEFTWERTARLTLESYRRALGSGAAHRVSMIPGSQPGAR